MLAGHSLMGSSLAHRLLLWMYFGPTSDRGRPWGAPSRLCVTLMSSSHERVMTMPGRHYGLPNRTWEKQPGEGKGVVLPTILLDLPEVL